MGMELFGAETGIYMALACFVAYIFSGHTGIYTSQLVGSPKHTTYTNIKGKSLNEIINFKISKDDR